MKIIILNLMHVYKISISVKHNEWDVWEIDSQMTHAWLNDDSKNSSIIHPLNLTVTAEHK